MDIAEEYFLDDIYEIEANGMLADIMVSTPLLPYFMDFDEEKHKKAISYIKSVFKECYKAGQLKVLISHEEKALYGFALLFEFIELKTTYLHKIFVHEKYRGKGLGTQMLQKICASSKTVILLCSADNKDFYEKNSFNFLQFFETPKDDNFKLSKHLYTGLIVMSTTSEKSGEAPIFFLNDRDLNIIAGVE